MFKNHAKRLPQNSYKKKLGDQGEAEVVERLIQNNFSILATNFLTKQGEVDIIARKDNLIAFIEVKFRKKRAQCTTELVNSSKQKKIILAAKYYITTLQEDEIIYRFDIALVTSEQPKITYIENAFHGSQW